MNPRRKRIKCNCSYCNKELEVIPGDYNRTKYRFCNEQCRQKWYAEIYSQTDEYRNNARKNAVKILKDMQTNKCFNTKPQIIINELLDEMGIKYDNEANFTYYSIDNYLPDYNLIIEVMGDYWHSSPLKYSLDNINDMQKRRIIKDKAKHTYIKNNYNIEILYLWENDIYENIDLCKKLISSYIHNSGCLENYHSFNYYI